MSLTLEEVISETNAHRENEEGYGLTDTLVEIVEFAYVHGQATAPNVLECIDKIQNFCEEREKYPLARLLDEVYDEINQCLEQENINVP
jgi:hypothetical protein